MELRQLRHILALSQHGSMAQAARQLGISQPALSLSLQRLEEQLGTKLFERTNTGVIATPQGQRLIARAGEIASLVDTLNQELQTVTDTEQRLTLWAGAVSRVTILGLALGQLLQRYPSLTVDVTHQHREHFQERIAQGEADLMITASYPDLEKDHRLRIHTLPPLQFHPVARRGHPLLSADAPELDELLCYPLVSPPIEAANCPYIQEAIKRGQRRGWQYPAQIPMIQLDDLGTALEVVRHSNAITFAHRSTLDRQAHLSGLEVLPTREPLETRLVAVSCRHKALTDAAQMLIQVFTDACHASQAGGPSYMAISA